MDKKKYFIENVGCDDTTYDEFEFTEDEFEFLNKVFEKLNRNSSYPCKPTIYVVQKRIETRGCEK